MNDDDDTRADGSDSTVALAVALTRLADTMPDDPYRLEGVHARVRRLRARRRVRLTAVGVVAAAAAVTSLVAVRSAGDRVATVPAAEPTTASALPACHAALTAAAQPETPSGGPADRRGVKGFGTIVGTPSEMSVTIHVDEPATNQPTELTATFTDQTRFIDAGVVGPKPPLAPGDSVAFAVEDVDGGYRLLLLEAHPDDVVSDTKQPVTDDEEAASAQLSQEAIDTLKAAKARADQAESGPRVDIKATAAVVSVQPGSVTLNLHDGQQAGQVIDAAIGPDTSFDADGTKCSGIDLVAGDVVGVGLMQGADGSYTAVAVALTN